MSSVDMRGSTRARIIGALVSKGQRGEGARVVEELVGRGAAEDALDVPARLLHGDLLHPLVQLGGGKAREPALHGGGTRVVAGHRMGQVAREAPLQAAQVGRADADVVPG